MNTIVIHMRDVGHTDREVVRIDRMSIWGNRFYVGTDGTREQVIAKYELWLPHQPDLMALIPTLRGKALACWCKPKACHGDVLARLADA